MSNFYKSKVPYLILSVPYNAPQLNFSLYINSHTIKKHTAFKFRNSFRGFKKEDPIDGQLGHQWEIGFKNYPLRKLTNAVKAAGWDIVKFDFTAATRSVFIIAKNNSSV